MSAGPAAARAGPAAASRVSLATASRGPLSTAFAAVGAWLLEPAEPRREPVASAPAPPQPVIAVFGLSRGCGATVVARALAAELARRDAACTAAVHCEARAAGIPLATQAASHLARRLAEVPGAEARAVGRLCLIGGAEPDVLADTVCHFAPLVLDAGTSVGGVPAALADRVVMVAGPSTEPALAAVAAECLARLGHEPLVVHNRTREPASAWSGLATHFLPDSRMGAQLALGGREPRGELGRVIVALADGCREPPK